MVMLVVRPVLRRFKVFSCYACAFALLISGGGHWLVLQSIAWSRMIVAYSRSDSLPNALQKTFDGKHPCCMCKKIKKARQEEKRQDAPAQAGKSVERPDLVVSFVQLVRAPSASRSGRAAVMLNRPIEYAEPPPTPPPRCNAQPA